MKSAYAITDWTCSAKGDGFRVCNFSSGAIWVSVVFTFGSHNYGRGWYRIEPSPPNDWSCALIDTGKFDAERLYYVSIFREAFGVYVRGRNETITSTTPNGSAITVAITEDSHACQRYEKHTHEFDNPEIAEQVRTGVWDRYRAFCVGAYNANMVDLPAIKIKPVSRSPYYNGRVSITEDSYSIGADI